MKSITRIAIALGLLLMVGALLVIKVQKPKAFGLEPQQQNNKRREKLARLKIDDFHGEAAALHVRQLRKLSKGITRAMQDAEKRGYRTAFEHSRVLLGTDPSERSNSVSRSTTIPQLTGTRARAAYSFVHNQETFTDGEYEVAFIPYDDGDPNTWEGIVYRYDPDWGDDIRFAVLDIQTDQPDVTQEIYYPPDGTDPQNVDPNDPSLIIAKNGIRTCKPATSVLSLEAKGNLSSRIGAAPTCPQGFKPCLRLRDECCAPPANLNGWFKCSLKACAGTAAACSKTGPAFGECWGFGCTGGMLLCLT